MIERLLTRKLGSTLRSMRSEGRKLLWWFGDMAGPNLEV